MWLGCFHIVDKLKEGIGELREDMCCKTSIRSIVENVFIKDWCRHDTFLAFLEAELLSTYVYVVGHPWQNTF